jgi:hypothetical protein
MITDNLFLLISAILPPTTPLKKKMPPYKILPLWIPFFFARCDRIKSLPPTARPKKSKTQTADRVGGIFRVVAGAAEVHTSLALVMAKHVALGRKCGVRCVWLKMGEASKPIIKW